MTTCKCGHNEDDHREGVFECGASIIHQEAEFFCGCEDFEPAEPSTEGTQAAQVDAPEEVSEQDDADGEPCVICQKPILEHSDHLWKSADDVPSVAQVDAGKCDDWEKELFRFIWVTDGQLLCNPEKIADIVEKIRNEGRDSVLYIRCIKHRGGPQYNKDEHGQECTECAVQSITQQLQPAVAQTESPPIPAASDCIMDFPQAFAFIAVTAADKNIHHPKCSYRRAGMLCDCSIVWAEYYKRQVASLTQRLQASEAREAKLIVERDVAEKALNWALAREAELKAEIAKMQMDNVIDYKAACEQHAANYEALERSHKALLGAAKETFDELDNRYDGADDSKTKWMGWSHKLLQDAIATAEKL